MWIKKGVALARINVDECWWTDPRRGVLQDLVGRRFADAIMVELWRLSQDFWKQEKRAVPSVVFLRLPEAEAVIQAGLARRISDDFIYVCGSEKYHEWIFLTVQGAIKGGKERARRAIRNHSGILQPSTSPPPALHQPVSTLLSLSSNTKSKSKSTDALNAHPLVEIWEIHKGPKLPSLRGLNSKRSRAVVARWRDHPSPEYWIEVVQAVACSPFLTGENERGWRATFDWVLKPGTADRILEGEFASKKGTPDFNFIRSGNA